MLNFMHHLTGPRAAQISGQTSFWVYVRGCFQMRITFESMDRGKQMLSPGEGGGLIQSVENLNRTKRLDLPGSQGELLLPDFLQARPLIFCLWSQAKTGTHSTGSPGRPACELRILRLPLILFLWRTQTNASGNSELR